MISMWNGQTRLCELDFYESPEIAYELLSAVGYISCVLYRL